MDYSHSAAADLPPGVWAPFAEGLPAKTCRADQLVYLQGSEAKEFYYVREGSVKSFISSEDGGERILAVYRAGDLMGEASFFDGLPRVSSAAALSPSRVVAIGRRQVEAVFAERPELVFAMLKYLARTVRLLSDHVDGMSFLPADRRVARYLLSLPGRRDGSIRCTHEEIGASVGASRVTVSRAVRDFAERGWVRTGYRSLTVLDRPSLQAFSEEG